jgi:hypothetical protein
MQYVCNCKSRFSKYDFTHYSRCLNKELLRFTSIYAYIWLFFPIKFKNAIHNDNYKTLNCPKQIKWSFCINIKSQWFLNFEKNEENI